MTCCAAGFGFHTAVPVATAVKITATTIGMARFQSGFAVVFAVEDSDLAARFRLMKLEDAHLCATGDHEELLRGDQEG